MRKITTSTLIVLGLVIPMTSFAQVTDVRENDAKLPKLSSLPNLPQIPVVRIDHDVSVKAPILGKLDVKSASMAVGSTEGAHAVSAEATMTGADHAYITASGLVAAGSPVVRLNVDEVGYKSVNFWSGTLGKGEDTKLRAQLSPADASAQLGNTGYALYTPKVEFRLHTGAHVEKGLSGEGHVGLGVGPVMGVAYDRGVHTVGTPAAVSLQVEEKVAYGIHALEFQMSNQALGGDRYRSQIALSYIRNGKYTGDEKWRVNYGSVSQKLSKDGLPDTGSFTYLGASIPVGRHSSAR